MTNKVMATTKPLKIGLGNMAAPSTLQLIMATADGKLLESSAEYMGAEAKRMSAFIRDARPTVGDVIALPLPYNAKVAALIVAETQTAASLQALGEKATKVANTKGYAAMSLVVETFGLGLNVALEKVTYGLQIAANTFSLKSTTKADTLTRVMLFNSAAIAQRNASKAIIAEATAAAMGSIFMRKLIQLPPNMMGTRDLFDAAMELKTLCPKDGLKVKMTKITHASPLRLMYNVGKVSNQDALLIEIRYEGDPSAPLTALVGKGLVFDTGGINLKSDGGTGMKGDMGGSAMVLGTILAAALRGEKVNLIGIIGAVSNDIGPDAFRPDDVLTAYNGKTVEITNTDAEGRLVLADCLSYGEEKYAPVRMFSFATLTGAAVVAHGRRAPVFSDDDTFVADLVAAAKATGEMIAPVPMDDYLKPTLNSPIADLRNTATGRMCGHTTAAIFLNHFVAGTPYLHVDIAGASDINGPGGGAFGINMMLSYLTTYARKG